MKLWDLFPEIIRPYDVRLNPIAAPTAGIFDAPQMVICVNQDWVGHIAGTLERLLYRDAWLGTEEQQETAILQIEALLASFAMCSVVRDIRMADCGLEVNRDGETWEPLTSFLPLTAGPICYLTDTLFQGIPTAGGINALRSIRLKAPALNEAMGFLGGYGDAVTGAQKKFLGFSGLLRNITAGQESAQMKFDALSQGAQQDFMYLNTGNWGAQVFYHPDNLIGGLVIQPRSTVVANAEALRVQRTTGQYALSVPDVGPVRARNTSANNGVIIAMQMRADATGGPAAALAGHGASFEFVGDHPSLGTQSFGRIDGVLADAGANWRGNIKIRSAGIDGSKVVLEAGSASNQASLGVLGATPVIRQNVTGNTIRAAFLSLLSGITNFGFTTNSVAIPAGEPIIGVRIDDCDLQVTTDGTTWQTVTGWDADCFTGPQGPAGPQGDGVDSVTVETLAPGEDATVSFVDGILELGIPRGNTGAQGVQGDTGDTGAAGATGPQGEVGPAGECDCGMPTETPGDDGEDKRCNVASYIADIILPDLVDQLLTQQESIAGASALLAVILGIVAAVATGPAGLAIGAGISGLIGTILTLDTAACRAELTNAYWLEVKCRLFCAMPEDGRLTAAVLSLLADTLKDIPGYPQSNAYVYGILQNLNPDFAGQASALGALYAGNCDICECDDCPLDLDATYWASAPIFVSLFAGDHDNSYIEILSQNIPNPNPGAIGLLENITYAADGDIEYVNQSASGAWYTGTFFAEAAGNFDNHKRLHFVDRTADGAAVTALFPGYIDFSGTVANQNINVNLTTRTNLNWRFKGNTTNEVDAELVGYVRLIFKKSITPYPGCD